MSRFAKKLVVVILAVVLASFSFSALAVGAKEPHIHLFGPTGESHYEVWYQNKEECSTSRVLDYKCVTWGCDAFTYVLVEGSSRSGPHKYIKIPTGDWEYYLQCEYCGAHYSPGVMPRG